VLKVEESNPDLDLLCIAAYLNLLPLATRLIEEGVSPAGESPIFTSPMQLAAWAGNAQMLERLQEHLAEAPHIDPQLEYNSRPLWSAKVHRGAILGAAILGNLDMVKLAIYPPSRSSPNSLDINGQKCGHVARGSHTGNSLIRAKIATRNSDIYKYL
jgi:ankyrin repeat protein